MIRSAAEAAGNEPFQFGRLGDEAGFDDTIKLRLVTGEEKPAIGIGMIAVGKLETHSEQHRQQPDVKTVLARLGPSPFGRRSTDEEPAESPLRSGFITPDHDEPRTLLIAVSADQRHSLACGHDRTLHQPSVLEGRNCSFATPAKVDLHFPPVA